MAGGSGWLALRSAGGPATARARGLGASCQGGAPQTDLVWPLRGGFWWFFHVFCMKLSVLQGFSWQDGRLDNALKQLHPEEDIEVLRQTVAGSLLQAAKDGSLERALETAKQAPPRALGGACAQEDLPALEALRKQAASSMLRAAEDGRMASVLEPKDLELMRREAAEALLRAAKDGSLEEALLKETSRAPQGVKALWPARCAAGRAGPGAPHLRGGRCGWAAGGRAEPDAGGEGEAGDGHRTQHVTGLLGPVGCV